MLPPPCATSGCEQVQQIAAYSITSSASASTPGGMARPSALTVERASLVVFYFRTLRVDDGVYDSVDPKHSSSDIVKFIVRQLSGALLMNHFLSLRFRDGILLRNLDGILLSNHDALLASLIADGIMPASLWHS
jgi:hypothetical protein